MPLTTDLRVCPTCDWRKYVREDGQCCVCHLQSNRDQKLQGYMSVFVLHKDVYAGFRTIHEVREKQ